MARISLRSIIDDSFVKRFQGLASGGNQNSLASALRGQSSQATISSGLRVGARTFATAVQGLNTAITFLNTSKATLQSLGKLTGKLSELAERASQSTASSQERYQADLEFRKLATEFKQVIDQAKLGDREFLTLEGISDYLTTVGLDKEESQSIAALFDRFRVPAEDDSLASQEAQADRPVRIPASAYSATAAFTVEYEQIFDEEVTIRNRPNAFKVLADLEALQTQIDDNIKVLDSGVELIGKNIDLVRAAGFAFLELSDQISDDADAAQVASELRKKINRDAPAALAQAENLQAIVVAALALDPEKLGISSE